MWFTKHSIKRGNENHRGRNSDPKLRKVDQRLDNLLYRKSKLESASETSAIISGFAIVALVEFSIDSYPDIPSRDGILTAYTIVSCILVSVHLLALLMSICILPEIKSVLRQKSQWIKHKNEEPLFTVNVYVETAWILSTGLGLFLILLELGLVFWIKVAGFSLAASIAAIVTLCFVGVPFVVFSVGFYIRIIRTKILLQRHDAEAVERGAIAGVLFANNLATTISTSSVNEIPQQTKK